MRSLHHHAIKVSSVPANRSTIGINIKPPAAVAKNKLPLKKRQKPRRHELKNITAAAEPWFTGVRDVALCLWQDQLY
jgi:hypothetical protein